MEMLAVVGFFIVCASICVSVFAGADRLSRKADDLNHAVLAAQSLMEELKSGKREEELQTVWDKRTGRHIRKGRRQSQELFWPMRQRSQ